MNVQEICKRQSNSIFETDELIFVIENYIKDTKKASIKINLLKGLHSNNVFFGQMYSQQLSRLNIAFNKASEFYLKS